MTIRQQPAASDRGELRFRTREPNTIFGRQPRAVRQRGNEVAVVRIGRQGPGGVGARKYRRSSELPVVVTLALATIASVVALAASPMREDD